MSQAVTKAASQRQALDDKIGDIPLWQISPNPYLMKKGSKYSEEPHGILEAILDFETPIWENSHPTTNVPL